MKKYALPKLIYQHDPYYFDYEGTGTEDIIRLLFHHYDIDGIKPDIIMWETHRFLPQECRCNDFDAYKVLCSRGTDMMRLVLDETRRRGIKPFWHCRICEVDKAGRSDRGEPNDIKLAHPDWVIKTWWKDGMWNLANPEMRSFKLDYIRSIISKYDFDGVCIDFLRHLPCLPVGRQW